jgi:hypothetical protein
MTLSIRLLVAKSLKFAESTSTLWKIIRSVLIWGSAFVMTHAGLLPLAKVDAVVMTMVLKAAAALALDGGGDLGGGLTTFLRLALLIALFMFSHFW